MEEDLDEVRRSRLNDQREILVEVILTDQFRLLRIRDVDDVDITTLFVVDDHRIRLVAGIPGKHTVGLVGGLLALAVHRRVAVALGPRRRMRRICDVINVEATETSVVIALLVVGDQDVTGKRCRRDRQRLHALARITALLGTDEGNLLGRCRVADVDDVDTVVLARLPAPGSEVGVTVVDTDVGDLSRHDILESELRNQLNVAALDGGQMACIAPVLSIVVGVGDLGVVDRTVVAAGAVMRPDGDRSSRQTADCDEGCKVPFGHLHGNPPEVVANGTRRERVARPYIWYNCSEL